MIETDNRKAGPLNCNGATTVFAFSFKCFAATDPVVLLADSTGTETTLVKDTDYTVFLNADQDNNPGGTITTIGASSPRAAGNTITVTTELDETQGTELPNGGGWFPKVVENALDKVTILCQQLRRDLLRSLRQPLSDATAISELPTAANRANKVLGFDATGQPDVYSAASAVTGSDSINFLQAGGAVSVTLQAKLREYARSISEFLGLQQVIDSWGNTYANSAGDVFLPRNAAAPIAVADTATVNNQTGMVIKGAGKYLTYLQAAVGITAKPMLKFINGAYCTVESMTFNGLRSATVLPPSAAIEHRVQAVIQPTPQGQIHRQLMIDGGTALELTVTGAANNGAGLVRLTLNTTVGLFTGCQVVVDSVKGTAEANGIWGITVIDATHIDLVGSVFASAWTSSGRVSSLGFSRGIRYTAAGGSDFNNERGQFENVDIDRCIYGISFEHYNSLVHQISGGVIGYCGKGITTAEGLGGSFSARGVVMIGNLFCDFDLGDNSTHSSDITDCKSEGCTGIWIRSLVTTSRTDINVRNSTYHGSLVGKVIDYRSKGRFLLDGCQVQQTGTGRKLSFSHAESVVVLMNNFFDIDEIEYAGTLIMIGNKYAGGLPALTALGVSSKLIYLDAPVAPTVWAAANSYSFATNPTVDTLINNYAAGTLTVVLPNETLHTGEVRHIKTVQAQLTISDRANVVPLAGGAAGTAILAAVAGRWATLKSDGTNWHIIAAN